MRAAEDGTFKRGSVSVRLALPDAATDMYIHKASVPYTWAKYKCRLMCDEWGVPLFRQQCPPFHPLLGYEQLRIETERRGCTEGSAMPEE